MTASRPPGPVPRPREAVRAVMLAPDSAVLLIRLVLPDRAVWIMPGGGLGPGESHSAALARELLEELGVGGFTVGPIVWSRENTFEFRGEWIAQKEWYYLVRTNRFAPRPEANPDAGERALFREMRWWKVEEIARSSETFAPGRLAALLAGLLTSGVPGSPLHVRD